MIKRKVFYGTIYSVSSAKQFDNEVNAFVEEIAEKEYVIIKYISSVYSTSAGYMDKIRTEIVYKETPTRKVLTEKK